MISESNCSNTFETAFSTYGICVLILSSMSKFATSVYFIVDGLFIGDKFGLFT
jgi:hypothetical protein